MNNEKIYQVVTVQGATYYTREQLEKSFLVTGFNESRSTREELFLEPRLSNMCGPMWNGYHEGKECIRYESVQAYAIYSC